MAAGEWSHGGGRDKNQITVLVVNCGISNTVYHWDSDLMEEIVWFLA